MPYLKFKLKRYYFFFFFSQKKWQYSILFLKNLQGAATRGSILEKTQKKRLHATNNNNNGFSTTMFDCLGEYSNTLHTDLGVEQFNSCATNKKLAKQKTFLFPFLLNNVCG
jgi:hypothetical protein